MKAEETFIDRFELYELHNYIFAKKHREQLEDEYRELEQDLYDDAPMVRVCVDYSLGKIYFGSGENLEDYVINMIERKEKFLKTIKRLQKQEELFDMAMNSLTPREKDVIQVHYFNRNNDLGLSFEFFQDILCEAQEKLCFFLGEEQAKKRMNEINKRQEQREQLKNDIKSGRIRVV